MFYSQFILAKKGPLGTIWIAAHLERKLRKNQVADTDIGVSVDSILFPEVPIALRLSSHLLLGVVRIYSRKVNYLFDDCSEALLKIKQAFRSTAVDLPPEESTAPYHSITLPETFDLDDFELPDSDIFQGNYVDHHVSAREQITLQDTMEGVVYSTTQFGLDERFGDGDTSGLDLDEELFLNKVTASGHAGVMLAPDADPCASVQPRTRLEQDKIHGVNENSEVIVATGRVNQLEGLAGNTDFVEYAQAPCTPGLVEEPNLSKTQEASVCDDHLELGEEPNFLNIQEASACDDHPEILPNDRNAITVLGGQEINQLESQGIAASTAGNPLSAELVKAISPASEIPDSNYTEFDGANRLQNLDNGVFSSNELDTQSVDGTHSDRTETRVRLDETITCNRSDETHEAHVLEDPSGDACSGIEQISEKSCLSGTRPPVSESILEINQASLTEEVLNNVDNAENMKKSNSPNNSVASKNESPGRQDTENPEPQAYQDPKGPKILNPLVHEKRADMHVLQLSEHLNQSGASDLGCNALVAPHFPSGVIEHCSMETSAAKEVPHTSGASTEVQGEGCHATDFIVPVLMENQGTEQASREDIQADFSRLNDQKNNVLSKDNQLENVNEPENSEMPAVEKLLSVPQGLADLQTNLLAESTPDRAHLTGDGGDAGISFLTGKKRSFTESTLPLQSLNSVESLGVVQSKRTKESVPDDNDLLSSILVGRRSSVLKMKPTPPPPPEMTSMKRPRSSRVCASKRKVLMDDTMVLHGDVIRQQLTSTDNIRRVRKKAPCTHPEIWMIQKEFLEDDIFTEPIFTGLSTGLALLHSQAYDVREIRVSQNDGHNAILEATADQNLAFQEAVTNPLEASNDMELSMEPNVSKEIGTQGVNDFTAVVRSNVEAEPPEDQQDENHVLRPQGYDTLPHVEAISDVQEYQNLPREYSKEIGQIDIDGASDSVADTVNPAIDHMIESLSQAIPVFSDNNNMPTSSVVPSALLDKEIGFGGSVQIDASDLLSTDQLDAQSFGRETSLCGSSLREVDAIKVTEENDDSAAKVTEENDDGATLGGTELTAGENLLLGETEVVASVEIEVDMQNSYLAHTNDANPSLANQFVLTIDQATEEIRKNDHGVVSEGDFAAELDHDGKNITSYGSSEEPKIDSSYSAEFNVDMKNVSMHNGEYPGCYETDPQCTMDAEIANVDHTATEDHGDFDYAIDGHDTGFLNADDDIAEEDEDFVPSAEPTSFLENSGWSSRTRAVAKYLQVLFDREAEHGRKVLPMDNLLVGKTRKEASRMFFEALVLKTKDYIHVEQGVPFDNINMKPRVKLMKSDF